MVRLEVEIFHEREVALQLLRYGWVARDMEPAFLEIYERFLDIERDQFDSEGRATGPRWRALKRATVRAKKRAGLDTRILHATHRLRNSLTQRSHPDHVWNATSQTFTLGTRVPYAGFHQSRGARRVLPRRPPVRFTRDHRQEFAKILQRHLVNVDRL